MKNEHSSAIADQVSVTGHNIKLDHFEILGIWQNRLSL